MLNQELWYIYNVNLVIATYFFNLRLQPSIWFYPHDSILWWIHDGDL